MCDGSLRSQSGRLSAAVHNPFYEILIMEYVYYHFRTNSISETWNTGIIEDFLRSTGLFQGDRFTAQKPFLSLSLMHVHDFEGSWSGKDYDPEKTNYISIVTSDNWYWGVRKDPQIQAVFDGLEQLLHTEMREDW